MKIYYITPRGKALARTTNNPDTPVWRVLHYLAPIDYATEDQVAFGTGLGNTQVARAAAALRRNGLVTY